MKRTIQLLTFCYVLLFIMGCDNHEYLGQKPPGDTPIIFAPGIVSLPDRKEEVITFSPDLKEVYYSIEFYPDPRPSFTLFTRFKNGKWSTPDTVSFSRGRRTSEPFMALDGSRIYYFANKVQNQKGLLDLCYSERTENGWSEPISLSAPPNFEEPYFTLHPSVLADSSIYFSAHSGEVCKSNYRNGEYSEPEVLPRPINFMNLEGTEVWGDPYVSQDEGFMIFRSNREGGYGGTDLYITFKTSDGGWTIPKNLGPKINTASDELGGDITPDGKYLTFGRDGDIYWVSAAFVEELR